MAKKQKTLGIAETLNDRYDMSLADVEKLGGKWSDKYNVFIFPDYSYGGFSDIKNGALEQTSGGESVFHFIGHAPDREALDPDYFVPDYN